MMNKSSCGSSSSNSNNRRIISSSWTSSSSSSNFRNSSERYCQTRLLRCYYFFIFNLILNILFFFRSLDSLIPLDDSVIRQSSPVHSRTLISGKMSSAHCMLSKYSPNCFQFIFSKTYSKYVANIKVVLKLYFINWIF